MGALLLSPLYLLVNAYVIRWLLLWLHSVSFLSRCHAISWIVGSLYAALALTPLLSFLCPPSRLRWFLHSLNNTWLGMFLYILLTILALDALRLFLRFLGPLCPSCFSSSRFLSAVGGFVVLFVLGISICGFFGARRLSVHQETLLVSKPSQQLRIALVSDLHLGYNTRPNQISTLVQTLNDLSPDLICFAGDTFDNEYDAIPHPEALIAQLSSLRSRYGVYACFGNHDVSERILAGFTFPGSRKEPQDPRFSAFLSAANIHLLADETVWLDENLLLAGRLDPAMAQKLRCERLSPAQLLGPALAQAETAEHAAASVDSDAPLIVVMDHQPRELTALSDAGADIVLSGHTHDGQLFPVNLLLHMFWENPCGILKRGGMYSCVSSGAGVWGPAMRVGTQNEILVLDVEFLPDSSI